MTEGLKAATVSCLGFLSCTDKLVLYLQISKLVLRTKKAVSFLLSPFVPEPQLAEIDQQHFSLLLKYIKKHMDRFRVQTFSQTDRKLIHYFDDEFIVYVLYKSKTWVSLWLQLLQCDNLLLFSVSYHCKVNVFRLWTVGPTKQDI